MRSAIVIAACFCLASPLWAQVPAGSGSPTAAPAKPVLPTGPLLRPVGDFSQWEIAFSYPQDKQKQEKTSSSSATASTPARIQKTLTTKTGKIIHEQTTDTAGHVVDNWFSGATEYAKSADKGTWLQSDPDSAPHGGVARYTPLPESGYRDLNFITSENYAGAVPYGGGSCLIFVPGGSAKLDLSDPAQQQKRMSAMSIIAYIDADSRLPVAVRTNESLRTYHFDPPPTEMQTFPTELADQIKKGQEGRARLEMPAPRPY